MSSRRSSLAFLLAAVAACSGGKDPRKLVLFHTNDEHSHLLGGPPDADDFPAPAVAGSGAIKGGIARRATLLDSERAAAKAAGKDVLTVSAGDNTMGTLAQVAFTTAAPDFRLMKLLGYDATTLGNHEFDYGPDALGKAIEAARASAEGLPVIVATNIRFSASSTADDRLANLYDSGHANAAKPVHKSWVLTTPGGLKVAFLGAMGANAATLAPNKAPVTFSMLVDETDRLSALNQLYQDLEDEVLALRRSEKPDLVVLLSHSGVDLANPELGEDVLIAQNVPGVDVVVSGHSHTDYPAQLVRNPITGRDVLVQQAGRYGDHVGRIELTVNGDGTVSFDTTASKLLVVDDKIVPKAEVAAFVSGVYGALESTKVVPPTSPVKSWLEYTLALTLGDPSIADAAGVGDLAFKAVAKSSFTVSNTPWQSETSMLVLAADGALAGVEGLGTATSSTPNPYAVDLAVQAGGVLRGELTPGKNGAISFADLFGVVPLGASPIEGSVGYPMTRFAMFLAEIKAAFEVTAGLAYTSETNGDFYLVPAGFCFTYDTSRPAFSQAGDALSPANGRVTSIKRATNHANLDNCDETLFSTAIPGGWAKNPLTTYVATANLYITTFAYLAGVKLKNPSTGAVLASPYEAILRRPAVQGGGEVKEWEVLGSYLKALSPPSGSGDLPARYKTNNTPAGCKSTGCGKRAICTGPLCKER